MSPFPLQPLLPFVAIDFETADHGFDSACAVALVRVEGGNVVRREVRRIRPPRSRFEFTHVHGIRWRDVEKCPPFLDVWTELASVLDGVEFVAAHNASFDRRVLEACCEAAEIRAPRVEYRCTVQLARATWRLFPTKLPDVCRFLSIPLVHHDALSDAEACAAIVVHAHRAASHATSAGCEANPTSAAPTIGTADPRERPVTTTLSTPAPEVTAEGATAAPLARGAASRRPARHAVAPSVSVPVAGVAPPARGARPPPGAR